MVAKTLIEPDNTNPLAVGPHIFFRPIPGHIDVMYLGVATAETYTVPATAKWVVFSSTADFYINPAATAALPTTEVTNGSAAELNPVGYVVEGGESLSFISPTAAIVTISVYSRR